MFTKLFTWRTRTRNKILAAAWACIILFDIAIIIGWFLGRPDAPAMFGEINGGGGLWAGLNAASIAVENLFIKKGEKSNE